MSFSKLVKNHIETKKKKRSSFSKYVKCWRIKLKKHEFKKNIKRPEITQVIFKSKEKSCTKKKNYGAQYIIKSNVKCQMMKLKNISLKKKKKSEPRRIF
jgi:hypothetical protein